MLDGDGSFLGGADRKRNASGEVRSNALGVVVSDCPRNGPGLGRANLVARLSAQRDEAIPIRCIFGTGENNERFVFSGGNFYRGARHAIGKVLCLDRDLVVKAVFSKGVDLKDRSSTLSEE